MIKATDEEVAKLPKCNYCGQITTNISYHQQSCKMLELRMKEIKAISETQREMLKQD